MTALKITPQNWKQWDCVTERYDRRWNECTDIMLSLNNYLDEKLGTRNDWGGIYASWLESFGFPSNSENGWWSWQAVQPENIELFINDNTDPEGEDIRLEKLRSKMRQIRKLNKGWGIIFSPKYDTILECIEHSEMD